jgi:glycosyl transferase, family 25
MLCQLSLNLRTTARDIQMELKKDINMVTYVINMKGADVRMDHMKSQLAAAGLEYVRQEGVLGLHLKEPHENFSTWSYRFLHGRGWAPRELGCYLSHIECLKKFITSDHDYALILEDDATVDKNILDTLIQATAFSNDWNMLRLSTVNHGKWFPVRKIGNHSLSVCLTREKGAGGYLVDKKAASSMLKKLLPMRLAWDIAFDLEWLLGFKTLGVYPMPIQQDGFDTQIQQDLQSIKIKGYSKYITVLPFRIFLEVTRLLYRSYQLITLKYSHRHT